MPADSRQQRFLGWLHHSDMTTIYGSSPRYYYYMTYYV
jgi:hypothetical protein